MNMRHILFVGFLLIALQVHSPSQPPAHSAPSSAPAPPPPSTLLQPSLTTLDQTLSGLQFDHWRRGTIRDEAASNVSSIQKDIRENMPPLLKEADASPSSLSVAIPVLAHVNALYDVLLRVVEASRVSGPADQVTSLQQALSDMGKARRALEDQMQQNAAAHEKEVITLRARLNAQTAARPQTIPVPMILPCGAFVVHHPVKRKPKAAAPGTAPGSAPPANTAKPAVPGGTPQLKKTP
jgi:hypothetical protein